MRDRLIEVCGREFERKVERHVKAVFEAKRGLLDPIIEVPWIGGVYCPRDKRENYADLMQQACKAACAQKWFDMTGPKWARPFGLPLRMEDFDTLERDPDNKQKLLGMYGRSLRWEGWDYLIHPSINVFGSGVTEFLWSPRELRTDPELQRLFPPRRLEGLTWTTSLCWHR
jgi:hypothetical protein